MAQVKTLRLMNARTVTVRKLGTTGYELILSFPSGEQFLSVALELSAEGLSRLLVNLQQVLVRDGVSIRPSRRGRPSLTVVSSDDP
jgi:hypothetical protein